MLSLSEDLLFVWEPTDLVTSWHAHRLAKWGEKSFSKKSVVVDQKILVSKRCCIRSGLIFGKRYIQGIFGENRKFHNCIIINK